MGRYIDWYLVELEGCLEGKLRPDRANDLVCQAEAHLVEASDQLRAKGMVEKASELAAIQKFGRAQKIADEATGGRRVSQVFAKLAMFGSFAAFTGLAPLSLLRLGPSDWFVQTYLWICAAVFFIAAMFVKRVPWRELTALGVTGLARPQPLVWQGLPSRFRRESHPAPWSGAESYDAFEGCFRRIRPV